MHTYESWQIAPFRNPVEGEFGLQDYNNGWMRAVAYKYLFIIHGAGLVMVMANHGYNGFKTHNYVNSPFYFNRNKLYCPLCPVSFRVAERVRCNIATSKMMCVEVLRNSRSIYILLSP